MSVTYSKLRSGDWGIRSTTELQPGQSVTVVKRDGGKKTETVDKLVWSGNGVWLATIRPSSRGSSPNGGNVCAECGRGGALVSDLEDGFMKHYRCCDIPP